MLNNIYTRRVTRIIEKAMIMTLVNGYLAYMYIFQRELTLSTFTNRVALAFHAEVGEVGEERAAAAMRGARQVSTDAVAQRANPDDIIRALFKVRALPLDGIAR